MPVVAACELHDYLRAPGEPARQTIRGHRRLRAGVDQADLLDRLDAETSSSLSRTSASPGVPKLKPRPAASRTAATTSGCEWPRIMGPHEPDEIDVSRPSTSVRTAPSARSMKRGVPPTAPKAPTSVHAAGDDGPGAVGTDPGAGVPGVLIDVLSVGHDAGVGGQFAHVREHLREDPRHDFDLRVVEQVDEMRPHTNCSVHGRSSSSSRKPSSVSLQRTPRRSSVVFLALDDPPVLEARDMMGRRERDHPGVRGEGGHPQTCGHRTPTADPGSVFSVNPGVDSARTPVPDGS